LLQTVDGDQFWSAEDLVADAEGEVFHSAAGGAELALSVGGDNGAHGVRVVGDDAAHGRLRRRHGRLTPTHFLHRQEAVDFYNLKPGMKQNPV